MNQRYVKKTCLLFGEGGKEIIFFKFLEGSEKFKSRFAHWYIDTEHAQGEACRVILQKCINVIEQRDFDLVLCFIDCDKLLHDFRKDHQKEKDKLEAIAQSNNIKIIWQEENHEAELERATKGKIYSKAGMKGRLKRHKESVINSDFVKKIFKYFEDNDSNSQQV